MLETVRAVLNSGGNLEASARAIFVHPNTVRYRLKRAADLTGLSATDPRGSWTLQVALALARARPGPLALALSSGTGVSPHHRTPRHEPCQAALFLEGSYKDQRVCFRAALRAPRSR